MSLSNLNSLQANSSTRLANRSELISRYQRIRTVGFNLNNRLAAGLAREVLLDGGQRLGIMRGGMLIFNSEDESSVLMDYCLYDVRRNGRSAGANFLHDKSQTPYLRSTDIDHYLGTSPSSGAAKLAAIRKMLKIYQLDPNWSLPSRMDDNPLIWMLTANGFLMDIRDAPRGAQEVAFEKGLIPYIPTTKLVMSVMRDHQDDKLKLGKSSTFFVKSQLKRLRQEDDIWEADFFPIPQQSLWIGLVISHNDDFVLSHQTIEEPPTVNHLTGLLAEAMRRPLVEFAHRPRTLYIRERPEWVELLPHLKQVGIQVEYQNKLPMRDDAFGDLDALTNKN